MTRKRNKKPRTINPLADRRLLLGLSAVIVLAVIAVVALVVTGDEEPTSAEYVTLDAPAAYDRYTQSDNAIIMDVREPSEWVTTGIPARAVTYSLTDLRQSLPPEDLLPKDTEVFVICNSGNRSQEASQILIDNGYQNVINIAGGIIAWSSSNLPVEPYTP